ncbi:uncharacterized protein LOC127135839 [Lathyrus oleraceus]|uniref:uncharacterized protein LOC127135839 n=1 Tax=Pisum sativum TaxID=3888 RepID=UPI0021CE285A|nr:uncharacterized protein LOC127135839 [Pisum sativum]
MIVEQHKRYKAATMYTELCGEKEQVTWRKIFFSNHARPQTLFVLWLALLGRLPTKDKLTRFRIHTDEKCMLCQENENIDHVFFECQTTGAIWTKIMKQLGYNRAPKRWTYEVKWLSCETQKKGWRRQILKIAVAGTMYNIWRARNDMDFSNKKMKDTIKDHITYTTIMRCCLSTKLRAHIDTTNICIC